MLTDVLSEERISTILTPMLHILDVLHLARTCKDLHSLYYGKQLSKLLCLQVTRDLGPIYYTNPLKSLNRPRTVYMYGQGVMITYRAQLCASCSCTTQGEGHVYCSTKLVKCTLCPDCTREELETSYFFQEVYSRCARINPVTIVSASKRVKRCILRRTARYHLLSRQVRRRSSLEALFALENYISSCIAEINALDLRSPTIDIFNVPKIVIKVKISAVSKISKIVEAPLLEPSAKKHCPPRKGALGLDDLEDVDWVF